MSVSSGKKRLQLGQKVRCICLQSKNTEKRFILSCYATKIRNVGSSLASLFGELTLTINTVKQSLLHSQFFPQNLLLSLMKALSVASSGASGVHTGCLFSINP